MIKFLLALLLLFVVGAFGKSKENSGSYFTNKQPHSDTRPILLQGDDYPQQEGSSVLVKQSKDEGNISKPEDQISYNTVSMVDPRSDKIFERDLGGTCVSSDQLLFRIEIRTDYYSYQHITWDLKDHIDGTVIGSSADHLPFYIGECDEPVQIKGISFRSSSYFYRYCYLLLQLLCSRKSMHSLYNL